MSLSRRHFVQLGSLSLLAGAVAPAAFGQAEGGPAAFSPEIIVSLEEFSRQTFEPYLADRIAISLAGRSLGKLTLIEVRDTTPAASKPQPRGRNAVAPQQALTGFALRFQGSGGRLPQGTYTFQQPALGAFPLFLVPAGPDVYPPTYTATFTRFATPGA